MADARADIIIDVDTSVGIAEIKALQRQISQLNAQLLSAGDRQAQAAREVQRNLLNNINATEQFSARVKTITSTTESFTRALETNKMSMGEYFRYAGGASKTFGRLFKSEFDTIQKVAESRVKTLQTQYVKLGRDANGALKAIAVRPLALDMENLSTKTAIAAQKQQLFNQLLKQGSTNLLNFGKNTQWAGRQLMVGFSIPLVYLGTVASKTFMQMEEQAIRFKRVYGETFTSSAETDKMIKQVQQLANEFTKYGVQVEKTMEMAAKAASMGKMGSDLLAQVNEATRLAVLGGVEQEQALETTISLTNAFGLAAEKLAGKIDFLNAVENQTVTAIEDLTIAIPKAGPVVQQLGGDVEDLAFFLTAMKEGGINASEGANALKSGLASLINPTDKASKFLQGFGINLKGIVEANKGDVKGLVVDFATALDKLDPLSKARAIEQLFGKFQFARLSTLFQNVIKEGSQAERVLKLSRTTAQELAILSERELKRVEESPMYKFKKAVEDLKVSLVPLGEAFLKAITPLVEFAKGFLEKFNSMGEGAKNFAVIATTVVAGIGPILLMTFGLIANGVANLIKMFQFIGKTMSGAGKSSMDLGSQTEYMTQQQLEAAAVASSLDQKHAKLIQTFNIEAAAVNKLATAYGIAMVKQSRLLGLNPETGMPIAGKAARAPRPKKYNSGVVSVPGPKGAGDVVPAMLSPGEAVIPADMAQKHSGFISDMINDRLPGYRFGKLGAAASGLFGTVKDKIGQIPVISKSKGKNMLDEWRQLNPRGEWGLGEAILRTILKKRGSYQGVSSTSVEEKLFDRFIRRPGSRKVAVRMFSDDFVGALGRGETRYQNVFERGVQSRGSLDMPGGPRLNAEKKLFGLDENTPASARPSYGYLFGKEREISRVGGTFGERLLDRLSGKRRLSSDPVASGKYTVAKATRLMNENTYRYGDIAMILKDRAIRGRTTITRGDSLNAFLDKYATPAPLHTRSKKKLAAANTSRDNDFFEAQIMGGFSFRDIKRIVATEPETILKLQEALRAAGIKGIKVGMPKYTMMQKLRKFVYGKKNTYERRLPRIQPESAGKYAGKYREDPLVINGRTFWNKGGFVGNADAIKTFAKANGNMFSQGLDKNTNVTTASDIKVKGITVSFAGQEFPANTRTGIRAKDEEEAKKIAQSISMLRSKGISDKRILVRLKNLTDPNGKYGPRLTAEKLRENFGFKASGEPKSEGSKRGKSTTAAPTDVAERRKHFDPLFRSEQLAMEKYAKKIGMSSSQLDDALGVHASHVVPERDEKGRKIWNNFKNLIPDMGYINQFLNSFQKSNIAKDLATKSKAELDALGISKTELNKLIEGRHPTTTKAAETLRAVASYYSKNTKSKGGKQYADLTAYGLGRRLKNKYYTKPIPTLAEAPVGKAPTATQTKPKPKPKQVPAPVPAPVPVPAARQQSTGFKLSNLVRVAKGGGAFAGILGMAGLGSSMMQSFQQNQFKDGVVSVGGPKGAGDVVPAMLSPGESVIPAKMTKKYAPLISGMINDEIPGYFKGRLGQVVNETRGMDSVDRAATIVGTVIGRAIGRSKVIGNSIVSGLEKSPMLASLTSRLSGGANTVVTSDGREFRGGAEVRTDKNGREYYVAPGKGRISKEEFDNLNTSKADRKAARRQARAGGVAGGSIGMIGSMVGMNMMMSADPGQQTMGGIVTALSVVGPMLTKLPLPIMALVAAVGAAAFGIYKMNESLVQAREEATKMAKTFSSGRERMDKLAEFAGTVNPSETMDRIRAERRMPFQIATGKNTFGAEYLQSQEGQALLEQTKAAKIKQGGADAAKNLAVQLSQAVANNILTTNQAASIASNVGEAMRDYDFAIDVNATMVELLGPGGEDLTKDPLKVKAEIIEVKKETLTGAGNAKDLISGSEESWWSSVLLSPSKNRANYTEVAAAEAEFAQVFSDLLDMGQQNLDQLELEHLKRLEVLEAAGDLAGIEKENAKYAQDRASVIATNTAALKEEFDYIKGLEDKGVGSLQYQSASAIVTNLQESAKGLFADQDQTTRDLANLTIENISKNKDLSFAERATLTATIGIENLDAFKDLQQVFPVDEEPGLWKKIAEVTIQMGAGSQEDLINILPGFTDSTKATQFTDYVIRLKTENKDAVQGALDSQAAIDTMTTLSKTKGADGKPIPLDQYIDPEGNVTEKFTEIKDKFKKMNDAFSKAKGKKITHKVFFEVTGLKLTKEAQAYFESLPPDQQKVYTATYLTYQSTITDDDIQNWRSTNAAAVGGAAGAAIAAMSDDEVRNQIAQNKAWQKTEDSKGITTEEEEEEEQTTDGEKKENPIEGYLRKLKQIRNASIDTSKGVGYLIDLMGKGTATTSKFLGSDQKLLFAGYGTDFINAVNDMDDETKKKFVTIKNGVVKVTEAGKALAKAMSEIRLGDFQFSLVSGVAAINKQMFAMTRLTSLNKDLGKGALSAAEAFEIVQDESLAYAIATAATAEEVKTLVANFRELKDAQQKLLLSTPEGTQTWLDDYSSKVSNAASKAKQYIEAQKEIVNQDFESGENKSGRNKDKLNMGLLTKNITEAQNQLAEYQYNLDDLQYELSNIEEIEDKINKKYDERGEALNKIWEANSDIANQQKAQLDIAQALASGDISAAARAMQEEQRRRAQKAKEDQEKSLEAAREKELEATKSAKGKTRKQLEEEILQLNKKMAKLEEESVEPNERLLRLAETARNNALEAVGENGYLGQTEKAWAKIEAAARLAVVESEAFKESLKSIIDLIPGFSIKDGKVVFDEAGYKAGIPAPSATVTTPSGVGAGDAPPASSTPTDKPEDTKPKLNEKNSSYAVVANAVAGLYENLPAAVSKDAKVTDPKKAESAFNAARTGGLDVKGTNITITASGPAEFAKEVMNIVLQNRATANDPTVSKEIREYAKKENIALMAASGLKFAKGGLVPSFFGAGGFAKGTDTVPAMLTPGEFVMKRYAVNKYGTDTMKAINSGTYSGDSVYNYSINVSVKSNANPDDIASAVMSRINQVDSQRIRSNRY